MRKILILLAALPLVFTSCTKEENPTESGTTASVTHRGCASHEVHEQQLRENPTLAQKEREIEAFTKHAIETGRLVNGKIEIPVVVNVLWRTSAENISDAQIQSQIDVLNKDFNGANAEFNNIPPAFDGLQANVGISFVLEKVVRKQTTKVSWGTADAMKKDTKRFGGIAPTTPSTHLNLWVCTIGGGILGYAQFPGGSLATDGVVVDSHYFGNIGTVSSPYGAGRTATHEVGHWMNLRHIWGDTTCGTDYVADTPTHNAANYGNPTYPHYSTCTGTPIEMTMNYMDYTDDKGMYMFSNGQKDRMLSVFAPGGVRNSFAQ